MTLKSPLVLLAFTAFMLMIPGMQGQVSNYTAGVDAGAALSTGDYNTFVGDSAGKREASGLYNSYFGNQAGIDFNEQPPVAVTDGQLNAPEGAASISEQNGENLLYTDGNIVYDRNHQPMFNGSSIGGDVGSTQSSIIIPLYFVSNYYY